MEVNMLNNFNCKPFRLQFKREVNGKCTSGIMIFLVGRPSCSSSAKTWRWNTLPSAWRCSACCPASWPPTWAASNGRRSKPRCPKCSYEVRWRRSDSSCTRLVTGFTSCRYGAFSFRRFETGGATCGGWRTGATVMASLFQLRYYMNLMKVLPAMVVRVTWNNLSGTRQRALRRLQQQKQSQQEQQQSEPPKDKWDTHTHEHTRAW